MNIKFASIFSLAILSLAAFQARAESLVDGSADTGKARSITCSACHGMEGNSANPMWPNLAGQHAGYLAAQLGAFRDGTRQDPLMSAQALALTDEDVANLAVYFESLPGAAQAVANPAIVDRGEALYRGGNLETGVAACMACHGPTGAGNPAAGYPALKGQHATYTAKQLAAYADGSRVTDGKTRIMRDIAQRLSKEEIEALSSYVQGLK